MFCAAVPWSSVLAVCESDVLADHVVATLLCSHAISPIEANSPRLKVAVNEEYCVWPDTEGLLGALGVVHQIRLLEEGKEANILA